MIRYTRLAIVGVLMAALLAACASPKPTNGTDTGTGTASVADNTLKVLTVAQPLTVDAWSPYAHSGGTSYGPWGNILQSLVDWDRNTNVCCTGVLADSWTLSEDYMTWSFKLRQGIKFHDGSPFTASDVIHSYNRILKDKDSLQASPLKGIKEMRAPDPHTLIIITTQPDAILLQKIANRFITSETAYKKYGSQEEADKHPVGTGPYKFVEFERGVRFVIEKDPNYWSEKATYDRVIYKPISEASTRITALESGQVDIISNVPPHEVARLKQNKDLRVVSTPSLRMMFIPLNPTHKPLDNKLIRQAMVHAVDVDSIVNHVLEGMAVKMTHSVGAISVGHDPNNKPFPYDPEKAKQLLAQAGYPNGFAIDFYNAPGTYSKDTEIVEAIAAMLGKVGIKATIKTPEKATFTKEYGTGIYPMYLVGRGSAADASEYLSQYFETGITKRSMFSNVEVDKLLQQERMIPDLKVRLPILQKAADMIYEEAAAIFLFNYADQYAMRAHVDWSPRPDEYVIGYTAKPKK